MQRAQARARSRPCMSLWGHERGAAASRHCGSFVQLVCRLPSWKRLLRLTQRRPKTAA